jgi:hypothetical protein
MKSLRSLAVLFAMSCGQIVSPPGNIPPVPTPGNPDVQGSLDGIDASGVVTGWAKAPSFDTHPISVAFYWDGDVASGRLLLTVRANQPDHHFSFSIPDGLRDGVPHALHAYAMGPTGLGELTHSPKTFTLTTANPGSPPNLPPAGASTDVQGALESVDAAGNVKGWAAIPAFGTQPIETATFIDGTLQFTTRANQVRDDGMIGAHGFSYAIPMAFADGKPHTLKVSAIGLKGFVELMGSPKTFTLAQPSGPIGTFDVIDGNGVAAGWALDRSTPAAALTVSFYADGAQGTGTLAGTTMANLPRADVNTATGVAGDHGFNFTIPDNLRDGAMHALYAYVGSTLIPPSPLTFTLAPKVSHVDPKSFTIPQLRDLQGDLMLWVPALKPNYVNGVDPVTGMNQHADNGATPNGIANGWVWDLMIDRYPADKRETIYQAALALGYTHFAVQVTACTPGDPGYHGLMPTDAAFCNGHDQLLNTILQELWDHRLIPLCSGVSPTAPVAPGLDKSLCRLVMNDWDNSAQADCHLQVLAQTFPDAQILFEIPGGSPGNDPKPQPDSCSPSPFPTSGGLWLQLAQQKYNNFFGVAYEINEPDGIPANVMYLNDAHTWWRDIQEVRFETDTYWKFWDNLDVNAEATYNDNLQLAAPFMKGFMSGGSTHPPPQPSTGANLAILPMTGDMIDMSQVTILGGSPTDVATWPITTSMTSIDMEIANGSFDFSLREGPGAWPDVLIPGWNGGSLEYTIWLALKINGQWYASGFVQYYHGKAPSLEQSAGAPGNTQLQTNWYYDNRWAPMTGHTVQVGDPVGYFVTTGNERAGQATVQAGRERSNIVVVPYPDEHGAHYTQ